MNYYVKQLLKIFKKQKETKRGFEILPEFESAFTEGGVAFPSRATKFSAGYDICALGDYSIAPGEKGIIETGLTTYMGENEWMAIFVRSGIAFKKDMTLQNAVAVIDSDYYGKHIKILLRNEGTETFEVKNGDRVAQGIFLEFLLSEGDSLENKASREGGFGSTGVHAA